MGTEDLSEGLSGRIVKLTFHMLIVPRIRLAGAVISTQSMDRDNFFRLNLFMGGGGAHTRSPLTLSTVASVTVVGPEHLDLTRVLRSLHNAQ